MLWSKFASVHVDCGHIWYVSLYKIKLSIILCLIQACSNEALVAAIVDCRVKYISFHGSTYPGNSWYLCSDIIPINLRLAYIIYSMNAYDFQMNVYDFHTLYNANNMWCEINIILICYLVINRRFAVLNNLLEHHGGRWVDKHKIFMTPMGHHSVLLAQRRCCVNRTKNAWTRGA